VKSGQNRSIRGIKRVVQKSPEWSKINRGGAVYVLFGWES